MNNDALVAMKYARALLQLAQEQGQALPVGQELEQVAQVFGSGEGREALAHPQLPKAKKIQLIRQVLNDRVNPLVFDLMVLLLEKRRVALVAAIARAYQEAWQILQNREIATITSVIPLTPEQMEPIRRHLKLLLKRDVELQQKVDETLQAGARLELGDLVFDGTLRGRLQRLRRAITAAN